MREVASSILAAAHKPPLGPMDKAFAFGAKDWGFDSLSGLTGVNQLLKKSTPLGPMDKAFAYGAKDWGFNSPSGLNTRVA